MKKAIILFTILLLVACGAKNDQEVELPTKIDNQVTEEIPADKLVKLLDEQDIFITKKEYVVQDEKYKSLYPDMLNVIIKNNTDKDIRDVVIAFVGWDSAGLPVKIKGNISFGEGNYVSEVDYGDINLAANSTFGDDYGFPIDENQDVSDFEAIVVSYTTFEEEKWENPYYDEWKNLYEGKKIKK